MLLWREDIHVTLNVFVTDRGGQKWNRIESLSDLPWICAGDFNEMFSFSEKAGAADRSSASMVQFREVLVDCGLSDVGFSGPTLTWNNRREASYNI